MIRTLLSVSLALLLSFASFGMTDDDHEYAPITEKQVEYRNWEYKNVMTDEEVSLREFAKGKKLVQVFYFAHWCHSSNYQAPVTQKLYKKYKDKGFAVIGVSLYGNLKATRNKVNWWQFTFPVVGESFSSKDRMSSLHFKYRTQTGDNRKWATPWNIFLDPEEFEAAGEVLVEKAFVANGELIEVDAEKFIRRKLGLAAVETDD